MNKRLEKCIEISLGLRPKKQTGKSFHTTFIFNKNRILSIGTNNYNKEHPYHKMGKYCGYKQNPSQYHACLHSEISALLRLGEEDCSRYTFVNIRIDNNNKTSIAKPCPNCQRILNQVGYKKIIYSNSENGFDEILGWFFSRRSFLPIWARGSVFRKKGGVSKRIYKERIGKIMGKRIRENKR